VAGEQVIMRLRQERVHVDECANCEKSDAMRYRIEKCTELIGSLDEAERARLHEIGALPYSPCLHVQDRNRSTLVPTAT
jgi:hypothetical protein